MRCGRVTPESVEPDDSGLRLTWGRWGRAEGRYIGDRIDWSDVVAFDPYLGGSLWLRNGRIAWLGSEDAETLLEPLVAAGVREVVGPSVWSDLLTPFLDSSDDPDVRDERFARLAAVGLGRWRVRWLRCRVAPRMVPELLLTWAWLGYDEIDLLTAWATFHVPPGFSMYVRYHRFRRWADGVQRRAA